MIESFLDLEYEIIDPVSVKCKHVHCARICSYPGQNFLIYFLGKLIETHLMSQRFKRYGFLENFNTFVHIYLQIRSTISLISFCIKFAPKEMKSYSSHMAIGAP